MKPRIKNLMVAGTASLIMVAAAHSASAATAIFQDGVDGYAGTEDNQILDPGTGFDDANVGGRNTFQVGNKSSISTRRLLLRFDVTSLAGLYTSIDSASITLKKANAPDNPFDGTDEVEMYALADNNADWVEGNSIFVVTDGESSWNSKRHAGALWIGDQPDDPFTSGGGGLLGALQDTVVGASANDPVNTLYTWDLDPALVEQWIAGVNAGVLIKEANELDGIGSGTDLQLDLYSSEFGDFVLDAPQHPKLEVTFTPVALTGDFDNDNDVDGADFMLWQQLFDLGLFADDLTDWQNNFGTVGPVSAALTAVPEPTTMVFAVIGLAGLLFGASGNKLGRQ